MKKPRLVILSDLWGKQKSEWTTDYVDLLSDQYDIQYYDCCELGDLDVSDYQQEKLHHQFVNGGIDKAVTQLLALEKNRIDILSFSVGGTIAWKAALQGLDLGKLYALSATRLRHETEKPNCEIYLTFGKEDSYSPKQDWFDKMNINARFIEGEGHVFYKEIQYFK